MVFLSICGYVLALGIFIYQEGRRKRSLKQQGAANDKDKKEAAKRYERLQKDSDQQTRSLKQQIKRLGEDFKAFSEDLKKNLPTVLGTAWKAEHPDQLVPTAVKALFINVADRTSEAFANYDYTAEGGLRLGGAAETIIRPMGDGKAIFINPDVEKDLGT